MAEHSFPWAPGTATGIGSLPGTDPMEAARTVAAQLEDFPHLAELPDRGPGADMIGRTAALLIDIPVDTTPRGWRLSPERPGKDLRRARSMLSADLDAMEEALDGYRGPLKIQVAGPWTLAATLEQPRSLTPALADPGAVADLTSSLAEGTASHAAEVAKRVPGARIVIQFDEPALPAALAGAVPTPSGLSRVRAIDEEVIRERLRAVLSATPHYGVVHCCAGEVPFGIIRGCGADGVSFDLSLLRRGDWDALAETAEDGLGLLVGINFPERSHILSSPQPSRGGAGLHTPAWAARQVKDAWGRMGLPPAACAPQVVITPACGLGRPASGGTVFSGSPASFSGSTASPAWAAEVLKRVREAARILPEMMEEGS